MPRVTLLTGFPYIALAIIIPERFQIVDGESVMLASVRILPLLAACATGSFLGGALSSKKNNTPYTLVAAACLQLLGVTLMAIIPATNRPAHYAFQVIFGLGVGLCFSAATIMTNLVAPEQRTRAAAQGAVAQARVLGGCIGLAICTVVFNSHVKGSLGSQLTQAEMKQLNKSPMAALLFPSEIRQLVQSVYSAAFTEETRLMVVICAVMVAASLFTLERHPPPLEILTSMAKEEPLSSRNSNSSTELADFTRMRERV